MVLAKDIFSFLETLYPLSYSLDWDNSGLQLGSKEKEVQKVYFCLDLTTKDLEVALDFSANLIITHHPFFFENIKNIRTDKPQGKIISELMKNDITVYSMHTNLDCASQGVSDVLAQKFNINNYKVLSPNNSANFFKIVVYVPQNDFEKFRNDFLELPLGYMGDYSHCSFSSEGEGTFKPLEGATPYIGNIGELAKVSEKRIETIVKDIDLDKVISKILSIHPYEEPAYDIFPLKKNLKNVGIGRIGCFETAIRLSDFKPALPGVYKGFYSPEKSIKKVAISGGSGGKLIDKVIQKEADLFITGDIGYHDHLKAMEAGLAILDIGHEAESEILPFLKKLIENNFGDKLICF